MTQSGSNIESSVEENYLNILQGPDKNVDNGLELSRPMPKVSSYNFSVIYY